MRMPSKDIKRIALLGFSFCVAASLALSQARAETDKAPIPAPALSPAAASAPVPAPEHGHASTQGKYVQQMAVMDTPSKSENTSSAGKENAGAAALSNYSGLPQDLKNDLTLISSLEVPGWEGLPPLGLALMKNALLGPDGKAVEEAGGKPADLLVEYGCTDVVSRQFRRGQRNCNLSLFRFQNPDGAYGIYSTTREGSSTVIIRGQGSSEDQDSISFFSGNAMVFLSTTAKDDDEAKELLSKLADQIAPRLAGGPPLPRMISLLPHFERLSGSEKFFMGSKALRHSVNIPFGDSLLLDQSKGAAYADYRYSRPMAERLNLLLADFGDPLTAQTAFNSYVASMSQYSRKTLERSSSEVLCKMSDTYLMCGMIGPRIYVISGARKAASPSLLARELHR